MRFMPIALHHNDDSYSPVRNTATRTESTAVLFFVTRTFPFRILQAGLPRRSILIESAPLS